MQTVKPDATLTPPGDLMAIDALLTTDFCHSIQHLVSYDERGPFLVKRSGGLQYAVYRKGARPMVLSSATLNNLAADRRAPKRGGNRKKNALTPADCSAG